MTKEEKLVHVNITFRHTESSDALKQYGNEKITSCIKKFAHHDTEAHLVLLVEKNRQIAEVSCHCDGADFNVHHEGSDMYASIDGAVDKLSTQLRKHKDKLTSHH